MVSTLWVRSRVRAPRRAAAAAAVEGLDCLEDLRATAAYRRHLFEVLTADALEAAYRRTGAAP